MRMVMLASLLSLVTGCAAANLSCPEAITETPTLQNAPKPWAPLVEQGSRHLDQVAVYFGHPNQHGAQVPDRSLKNKTEETVIWAVSASGGEQYWVGCSYVGTTALLVTPVASSARECRARYTLLPTGKRLKLQAFTCE